MDANNANNIDDTKAGRDASATSIVVSREEHAKLLELSIFCQAIMRRARMESPLSREHSDKLGSGISAAERIEQICRGAVRRHSTNHGRKSSPCDDGGCRG